MKKKLFTALLVVFALTFLISGGMLIKYFVDSTAQEKVYDDLAQIMEQSLETTIPTEDAVSDPYFTVTDPQGNQKRILPEFKALYEENPDIAGWMQIEGTKLSYPVMYKPDSQDFYLRKNFYGEKATHGCLYIQETCQVFPTSDNVVIFGHNMKDGSMFACLKDYLEQSFWQAHPVIQFNTLEEKNEYEIFSVFTTTASVGEGFKFHTYIDLTSLDTFREFVDTCKEMSVYDTGVNPQFGDQFISLATCEYSQANGRLVVIARKITE